ncbi:hypothetical protein I4U23_003927 [Adineta vaga]|nr:hypothetical protein I4U23_003927 [Adineta vaga]
MLSHCLIILVLYSCSLGFASGVLTGDFFCHTAGAPEILLSNGPLISSNFSHKISFATDYLFQTPFQLTSTVQVTAISIFPRKNSGFLTVRAALYDAASMLVAQTLSITTSTTDFSDVQPKPWILPLDQPINLTAGIRYSAAYWFASSSNNGTGSVALFATSPANVTFLKPANNFDIVNGSFPLLLAAPYTFGVGLSAPFVQLIGSPCTNTVPSTTINLNDTILSILQEIRIKYDGIPALGASIIQMPTSESYTGIRPSANVICPFIPVSTVVSGVRRADALTPETVTVNDKWHLGSNTKAMTATLIQMLIQTDKLRLNTTVGDIFPYVSFSSITTPPSDSCTCDSFSHLDGYFAKSPYSCNLTIHISWKYVTIAHLLTHTSGLEALDMALPREYYIESLALEKNGTKESCTNYPLPSRRYHLSVILPMTIPNPPPSIDVPVNSSYSNNNFILLGLILEEIWSLPWESIIQRELFDPLGMNTAGFGSPIEQVPFDSYATQPFGHYEDDVNVLHSTDADNLKSWGSTGLVHANLDDWSKFIACHLQEGRNLTTLGFPARSNNFLNTTHLPYIFSSSVWQTIHNQYVFPSTNSSNSQHSLSELISQKDNIGLSLWHTGSNTVWYALVVAYPRLQQPMAVLVAANIASEDAVWEAKSAIINLYLAWQHQGQPGPVITSIATLSATSNIYVALILTFIALL